MKYILAFDLGTGGTKASLFDVNGISVENHFVSCETYFNEQGFHEQNPNEWWSSVVESTKELLSKVSVEKEDILAISVSGHSLGIVPIGNDELLMDRVPIWSDSRGTDHATKFFESINEEKWYMTTGNGFPPGLYSIFKLMWLKENKKEVYDKTDKFIGTKDYINYMLTGITVTDHSYASGSGVYSLEKSAYVKKYIKASGVDGEKLPTIVLSTDVLGTVLPEIAEKLGVSKTTQVVAGGVDNSCMALGAGAIDEGEAYTSLGSSSWIAVSSSKPIVDLEKRPYVFAHCVPGMYASATAIFSAGNSYRWLRDTICQNLDDSKEIYISMNELAETSPRGANGLIFNPSLAGGSSLDKSPNIKGAFIGLTLATTQADLIRATLEGICLNLRVALDVLSEQADLADDMLIVGGGAKSPFWRGLFADIFNKNIIKSSVGQDAGSLGAAALAAVGIGMWDDFSKIKEVHETLDLAKPINENVNYYNKVLDVFKEVSDMQSDISDLMKKIN